MSRIIGVVQAALMVVPVAAVSDVVGAKGSGVIVAPPSSVFPDATQGPDVIAFDERQDIRTPAAIPVDVDNGGLPISGGGQLAPGVIPANACIRSHYTHFDPDAVNRETAGFVFDADIVGIVVTQANLDASAFLGAPGTAYPDAGVCGAGPTCGFEVGFAAGVPGADFFDARNNGPRGQVRVDVEASAPADNMRVITEGICN